MPEVPEDIRLLQGLQTLKRNTPWTAALFPGRLSIKKAEVMEDPVYTFFSENLATVTKEELLAALKNALESATYWRQACLGGVSSCSNLDGFGGGPQ